MAGGDRPGVPHHLPGAGAGLTCTEMVSAKALCFQDKSPFPCSSWGGGYPPPPRSSAATRCAWREAAAIAHEVSRGGPHRHQHGLPRAQGGQLGDSSGLMQDPDKAVQVLEAVVRGRAVPSPSNSGWAGTGGSISCVEFARAMEGGWRGRGGRPRPDPEPDVRRDGQLGLDPGRSSGQ